MLTLRYGDNSPNSRATNENNGSSENKPATTSPSTRQSRLELVHLII